MHTALQKLRNIVRRTGFDVVRYLPNNQWPVPLGLDRLRPATVVDIGAFDGDSARIFRRWYRDASIVCIEPHPQLFKTMQRWVQRDGNAVAVQCALGAQRGEGTLNTFRGLAQFTTMRSLHPSWDFTTRLTRARTEVTVAVRTLDDVAAELNLTGPFVLKVDTEGYELEVIAGAANTLSQTAAVIIEAHSGRHWEEQPTLRQMMQALEPYELEYAGNMMQHADARIGIDYLDAAFVNRGRCAAMLEAAHG